MKKVVLAVLLFSVFAVAAPNPEGYAINVHVSSSHWAMASSLTDPQPVQRLDVIINGKKYELETPAERRANLQAGVTLLAIGDYKAKLVQDVHKTAYESSQAYEFLFPDNKTRKFFVVGQTE